MLQITKANDKTTMSVLMT